MAQVSLCTLGIEMCLENWRRVPRALFAKAWVTTGHVTKERVMEAGNITEEQWESCKILDDPLGLFHFLGLRAADEPSLEELIENGRKKRRRVVWVIACRNPADGMGLLPASLVHPVEKKLCNYIFQAAGGSERVAPLKQIATVLVSRRSARECSVEMLRKHTVLKENGARVLKEDAGARAVKEIFFGVLYTEISCVPLHTQVTCSAIPDWKLTTGRQVDGATQHDYHAVPFVEMKWNGIAVNHWCTIPWNEYN